MITALVVDDIRTARLLVRHTVEKRDDIEVVGEAETADEALQSLHRLRPDLVFLDLALPDRDGLSVIGLMRQIHPGTRIIVISAAEDQEGPALAAGAYAFLSKPVRPEVLNQTVDAVLAMSCAPQSKRVLLVEDEPTTSRLLTGMLSRIGCTVVATAATLGQAEAALQAQRPDLLVLDVMLADGSSLDWLQQHPDVKRPPTIIVSSHAEREVVQAALSLGASAYVLKPVQPTRLAEAIARAMASS